MAPEVKPSGPGKKIEKMPARGQPGWVPGPSERFVSVCKTHGQLDKLPERQGKANARGEGHKSACQGPVYIMEMV